MSVHRWASLTWPAFRAVSSEGFLAVLPLGALEAHGPHLPLGTDIVIAEAMARAGAERLSLRGFHVVCLPALPTSPAPFGKAFAGTVDTPGEATTAMVAGVATSVARHGGRATVVANAHHDPAHVAAIRDAEHLLVRSGAGRLIFPDLTRRRWARFLGDEFATGACHAGRYEGSIVLADAPALVDRARMKELAPNPRSLVDAVRDGQSTFEAAGGPEAYFGWPADASADEGREIIGRLGAVIEQAVLEALATSDHPHHD
ncbi:MAG: creatininase family protein [Acidobacteriota bacterium]